MTNEKNNEQQYAIGSGGYEATRFLLDSNIHWKSATGESAEDAAFKALLCACLYDKYSGGYLTVTCLHGEGCITQTYTVLEVYNRCFEPAKEETTLFLLHSTSSDLILGEDSKITLLKDIWPKLNLNSIRKWNMIAKKAYFYIYWLKLKTKTEAEKLWSLVENCNPKPCFPQNLSHIRSKLVDYKRRDNRDDVYIGRSSKELVEGLCDLEDAKDLRY